MSHEGFLTSRHSSLGAVWTDGSKQGVAHYGEPAAEHRALVQSAGLIDLSHRGRICLTGSDRARLLHGQVTNDVTGLKPGTGCYAAMVNAKGKFQCDLFIYALADELLLDFEPGLDEMLEKRFDHYIVADDVQVVNVAPHFGLLSIQGPAAAKALHSWTGGTQLPDGILSWVQISAPAEVYIMRQNRAGVAGSPVGNGFDLFIPAEKMEEVWDGLLACVVAESGRAVGTHALELARIEAGIPRFGSDMDETNLPPEAGIDRAISYSKGCYIGQEVIARIRTYGQVAKSLKGLRLEGVDAPPRGSRIQFNGKDVGYVTSTVHSQRAGGVIALGYIRREVKDPASALEVVWDAGKTGAKISAMPFAV